MTDIAFCFFTANFEIVFFSDTGEEVKNHMIVFDILVNIWIAD